MIYETIEHWKDNNPLKKLRNNLNISQVLLADTIGVSVAVLYTWERGRSLPSADNCRKLTDMGLKMEDLIEWKKSKPR